jgi:hypothetical protein
MKKFTLLIITVILLTSYLVGCSQTNEKQFIQELAPNKSKYKIHLFNYNRESSETDTLDMNEFINSDQRIAGNFYEFEGHDYLDKYEKKLKSIHIDYYPVYLIVDKEGIKLKTQYLSKVKEFIKTELDK